uniref:Tetraspanin n=1 Tax=Nothobranchius furzeri TaxID=105023 RepID=A0A8C6KXX3_NOTFU
MRERGADKARTETMNSALSYDSLSARPSPTRRALDWEREQLAVRRLSSPLGVNLLTPLPRRPSAIPGAAVTAWGFLGCLGVAANLPCLLRAYGFFQLATLVAGLAAGLSGLFYREEIAGGFRSGLQRAVAGYTEDEGRADALDSLQRALECCGGEGWLENGTSVSLPDSCCVRRKGCRNPTDAGIHPQGCFRKVFSLVNDNVFHIAATVLALAFMQIGGITLACLLANKLTPRQHGRPCEVVNRSGWALATMLKLFLSHRSHCMCLKTAFQAC